MKDFFTLSVSCAVFQFIPHLTNVLVCLVEICFFMKYVLISLAGDIKIYSKT